MSKPERLPYIGVTGFYTTEEVRLATIAFTEGLIIRKQKRHLMIGVLATYKSLRGIPMKPKWAQQTPDPRHIHHLFTANPHALNLVHFSTGENVGHMTILGDMVKAMIIGGEHCHGLQLNMVWPEYSILQTFRDTCAGARIVLQIGNEAAERAGTTPKKIARTLWPYKGLVDDILFDPSGGHGQPFIPSRAQDVLSEIAELDMGIGLGVAGGLGPDSLHLLEGRLLEKFPNLSIDAQGQLRDADNNLDIIRARNYIAHAALMLEGIKV